MSAPHGSSTRQLRPRPPKPNSNATALAQLPAADPVALVEPPITPTLAVLRLLMQEQVITEQGRVEQLRREYADLTGSDDYLVPNYARWDLVLLMRGAGHSLSDIASTIDLPFIEVMTWFRVPGIVRDIWELVKADKKEQIEIRLQNQALVVLSEDRPPSLRAMETVTAVLERAKGTANEPLTPGTYLDAMLRNVMPSPKALPGGNS